MKNFLKNFFLPLKVRILIIIIFPVIFYPFIILYFNKYQEILINSEFLAMERQGTTFAKAIGMAEDQYGLIEKNKISGVVYNEETESLIGVNISVKNNLSLGTTSNFNGDYSISLPDGCHQIKFQYI